MEQVNVKIEEFNLGQFYNLMFLFVIDWLLISVIRAFKVFILSNFDVGYEDNLKARKVHTQVKVLSSIGVFIVLFIFFIGGLIKL